MFDRLDIYTPRERWAVGLADAALSPLAWPGRWRRRSGQPPKRILLLRLERIGDLLMTLGAVRAVRLLAPDAEIDLVVGSWNESLARLIGEVTRVETLDLPWLARGAGGAATAAVAGRATGWRTRRYDLAINFEGDIRSHGLLWLSGARRRVGFDQAGGGPLLTDRVTHDPRRHVGDNSLTLVERAFDRPEGSLPRPLTEEGDPLWRLRVPEPARAAARAMAAQLAVDAADLDRPWLAVHAPGGRLVKQWPVDRFGEAAIALARRMGAVVVLTGGPGDAEVVAQMTAALTSAGIPTIPVPGTADLVVLAALLAQCRLLLTGDTGPMHLAAAAGTPVLAVFGPSMPWRYGPLVRHHRVVRVDLPCSPCNRIRLPPVRCQGHSPDCLTAIPTSAVVEAGVSLLAATAPSEVAAR
jgi:ADP-heptose:LPS heptosyltransferase